MSENIIAPELQRNKVKIVDMLMTAFDNVKNARCYFDQAEDEEYRQQALKHIDEALYLLRFVYDHAKNIGKPQSVEKYFNVIDGDVVECSREEYKGILPEDDADELNPALP